MPQSYFDGSQFNWLAYFQGCLIISNCSTFLVKIFNVVFQVDSTQFDLKDNNDLSLCKSYDYHT